MARKRDALVPIAEVFSGLDGPGKAHRKASSQARHHFTQVDQGGHTATPPARGESPAGRAPGNCVRWQGRRRKLMLGHLQRRETQPAGANPWRPSGYPMAMGKKKGRQQEDLWVATSELPRTAGHPFYERLNGLFNEHGFDDFVEGLCAKFYADKMGRPSLTPGVYFRLLLVGYFEGIGSERGIAWRAADSLASSGSGDRGVIRRRLAQFQSQKLSQSVRTDSGCLARKTQLSDPFAVSTGGYHLSSENVLPPRAASASCGLV